MAKSKVKKSATKGARKKRPSPSGKTKSKPAKRKTPSKLAARAKAPESGRRKPLSKSSTNGKAATAKMFPKTGAGLTREKTLLFQASQNSVTNQNGIDLGEKIRELLRLAKEQGHLTYGDINDALPDGVVKPEDLDEIYIKLRNLEVEIVAQAEVDRIKQPEPEEGDGKTRLDILDDPVRMYLKQMGQVPLLTRDQEVEISKRIEDAEGEVKRIIYGFGFSGKEHIALAEKLISEPPKERFDRVILDKKIESRDNHLRALRRLVKDVRSIDQAVDHKYAESALKRITEGPVRLENN